MGLVYGHGATFGRTAVWALQAIDSYQGWQVSSCTRCRLRTFRLYSYDSGELNTHRWKRGSGRGRRCPAWWIARCDRGYHEQRNNHQMGMKTTRLLLIRVGYGAVTSRPSRNQREPMLWVVDRAPLVRVQSFHSRGYSSRHAPQSHPTHLFSGIVRIFGLRIVKAY